jgi:hypothetical protein
MNVEIGTEAAQFSEEKYIYGILLAVCTNNEVHVLSFVLRSGAKCSLHQAQVQPLHGRERRLERGQGERLKSTVHTLYRI